MKFRFYIFAAIFTINLLSLRVAAQSSDTPETPLGDIARALRKEKKAAAPAEPGPRPVVIDNDNLSKVMDEAETQRLQGKVKFSFSGEGQNLQVSSPDVTCSLSFSAQGTMISEALTPQDLPASELVKLDGPATINGNTLQVSIYNPTRWKVDEITVGLTILRKADARAGDYAAAKVRPAALTSDANDNPAPAGEKRPDMTLLYHLKGSAAPFTTAVFRENLGTTLDSDQDWHWAIVEAKGMPPK